MVSVNKQALHAVLRPVQLLLQARTDTHRSRQTQQTSHQADEPAQQGDQAEQSASGSTQDTGNQQTSRQDTHGIKARTANLAFDRVLLAFTTTVLPFPAHDTVQFPGLVLCMNSLQCQLARHGSLLVAKKQSGTKLLAECFC